MMNISAEPVFGIQGMTSGNLVVMIQLVVSFRQLQGPQAESDDEQRIDNESQQFVIYCLLDSGFSGKQPPGRLKQGVVSYRDTLHIGRAKINALVGIAVLCTGMQGQIGCQQIHGSIVPIGVAPMDIAQLVVQTIHSVLMLWTEPQVAGVLLNQLFQSGH